MDKKLLHIFIGIFVICCIWFTAYLVKPITGVNILSCVVGSLIIAGIITFIIKIIKRIIDGKR